MTARAVVIINPFSGRGRHAHEIEAQAALARDVLAAHAIEADVRPTAAAGDATAFARDAAASGCGLVIAWGGDGTINETARALANTGIPLGIVPAGSGNGLAADLRLPFEPRAALAVAAGGRTLPIDAGQIDECLFFNVAGVGLDAVVAARFAERGLRRRGAIAYLRLTTQTVLRYQSQTYRLTIDGDRIDRKALLIAIANGRQYGNRLMIAPGARLDDGLLEVVVVGQIPWWSIARRLPAVFRGRLRSDRDVMMRTASSLRIEAPGPIPFHVDGEPRLGGRELRVQVHRRALHVRVPQHVTWQSLAG